MTSMKRRSRAERESATTTRQAGLLVVPVVLSLMWTATGSPLSCGLAGQERQGAFELAHASFHLLETFHHLLELRVLLEEPVHVGNLRAAALGDPGAPAAVDD